MKRLFFISLLMALVLPFVDISAQDNNENVSISIESIEYGVKVTVENVIPQNDPVSSLEDPTILQASSLKENSNNDPSPQVFAQSSPQINDPPNDAPLKDDPEEEQNDTFFTRAWKLISGNWGASIFAFMAFLKVFVNLTPTERDNKIFAWLDNIINQIFPNRKVGGGQHPPS